MSGLANIDITYSDLETAKKRLKTVKNNLDSLYNSLWWRSTSMGTQYYDNQAKNLKNSVLGRFDVARDAVAALISALEKEETGYKSIDSQLVKNTNKSIDAYKKNVLGEQTSASRFGWGIVQVGLSIWQIVSGAFIIVAGIGGLAVEIAAIPETGFSAALIPPTLALIAGGWCTITGAFDSWEGVQDVRYGYHGDTVTPSSNWARESLFKGNDLWYYGSQFVAGVSGGIVRSSIKAGTKTGAKIVAEATEKEILQNFTGNLDDAAKSIGKSVPTSTLSVGDDVAREISTPYYKAGLHPSTVGNAFEKAVAPVFEKNGIRVINTHVFLEGVDEFGKSLGQRFTVDMVIEKGGKYALLELKSSATASFTSPQVWGYAEKALSKNAVEVLKYNAEIIGKSKPLFPDGAKFLQGTDVNILRPQNISEILLKLHGDGFTLTGTDMANVQQILSTYFKDIKSASTILSPIIKGVSPNE